MGMKVAKFGGSSLADAAQFFGRGEVRAHLPNDLAGLAGDDGADIGFGHPR